MNLFDNQDLKFISIIIHGSQGDGFITNYSDVDATVIIHNELISNLDDINEISHQISKLNNQIKIYDPLSHHNVFLTLSSDLDCYPESFMPIKVLNDGKKLMNKEVLFNATRFDLDLKIESFINLVSRIIKITNKEIEKITAKLLLLKRPYAITASIGKSQYLIRVIFKKKHNT